MLDLILINIKKIFLILFLSLTQLTYSQTKNKFVLVLDAGHGGEDHGALGTYAKEKDVALNLALKIGEMIIKNNKDVEVIYTRKTDVFIPLMERAAIANRNHADLFMSIHCNSTNKSAPYGTETFVLGIHRSEDNFNVAKRENEVIYLEKDYKERYEGFNPSRPESIIGLTLLSDVYLKNSLSLAKMIEDNFVKKSNRLSRGVKQAGFLVLVQTAMPSVLIETGFLSNPDECFYMSTEKGQNEISRDIYSAFVSYRQLFDEKSGRENVKIPLENPIADPKPVKIDSIRKTGNITPPRRGGSGLPPSSNSAPVDVDAYYVRTMFLSSDIKFPDKALQFRGLQGVDIEKLNDRYVYYYGQTKSPTEAARNLKRAQTAGFQNAVNIDFYPNRKLIGRDYYTIELFSSVRFLTEKDLRQRKLHNVKVTKVGNIYYYTIGRFLTYNDAIKVQKEVFKIGLKNSVITQVKNQE